MIRGLCETGEYTTALQIINAITISKEDPNYSKYLFWKSETNERLGNYNEALGLYKDFSNNIGFEYESLMYDNHKLTESIHQLGKEKQSKIKSYKKLIKILMIALLVLIVIMIPVLFKYLTALRHQKETDKDINKLKAIITKTSHEMEDLNKEKHSVESTLAKTEEELRKLNTEKNEELAKINVDKDNQINKHITEKSELKETQSKLKAKIESQSTLIKSLLDKFTLRQDLINEMLAREITNDKSYTKQLNRIKHNIHNEPETFLRFLQDDFEATHPSFMNFLKSHNLSKEEIEVACLLILGLRAKDIGTYLKTKDHYKVSSNIRKKLGIDEHEKNLGLYLKSKMDEMF